jgi:hypothetical protein
VYGMDWIGLDWKDERHKPPENLMVMTPKFPPKIDRPRYSTLIASKVVMLEERCPMVENGD